MPLSVTLVRLFSDGLSSPQDGEVLDVSVAPAARAPPPGPPCTFHFPPFPDSSRKRLQEPESRPSRKQKGVGDLDGSVG